MEDVFHGRMKLSQRFWKWQLSIFTQYILIHFFSHSVHVAVEEKITVVANRDGGLETMEIKGSMTLKIADPNNARVRLLVRATDDVAAQFQVR